MLTVKRSRLTTICMTSPVGFGSDSSGALVLAFAVEMDIGRIAC